jgi:hypothetical protein
MKIKHLGILSAATVALLSLSGAAQAGGLCSNATLKGPFGFIGLTLPANFVSANRAFIMPLAFSVRRASFVQIASD